MAASARACAWCARAALARACVCSLSRATPTRGCVGRARLVTDCHAREAMNIAAAHVLDPHIDAVNTLDFSKDGELMLTSGDDKRISLISPTSATVMRVAQDNAHGVEHARFTHDPMSIVVASPSDHAIRYMSLHDNRYLRSFRGHKDRIVALEMSPKEDFFASAALDGTARIWDLRQTNCQGTMNFAGDGRQQEDKRAAVAFDPHGLVFVAAIGGSLVKLFDVRAYDKGPFFTFTPDLGQGTGFTGVKFSNDGKLMLLSTTRGDHALLDAFKGDLLRTFASEPSAESQHALEACFSADSEFILAGGTDGSIWRWATRSGQALPTMRQVHQAPVRAIRCNPTRMMVASACANGFISLMLPAM